MRSSEQQDYPLLFAIGEDLSIAPCERGLLDEAQAYLDRLTKPRGSLGRLEELAQRLFAMRGGQRPLRVSPAILFTIAADHGVAKKQVSAYPQEVTRQMVENFLQGGGAINALSREAGMNLCLVDAGCCGGPFAAHPLLLDRRIGDGTADISEGPAMSRAQAIEALRCGVTLAREAALDGCQCLAIGEMGIANTTSATALFSAYLDLDAELITGPGTGLSLEQIWHKISVIRKALRVNEQRCRGDAIDILAALGGFEIAMMSGVILGSAIEQLPVLVDGFIATAAYVAARAIGPHVPEYAIVSHVSAEPGYSLILQRIGEEPLLALDLCLGEGTGCALAYPLVRAAAAIFNEMATFDSAGVTGAKDAR
ncbi:MAG: nicotinate-nucleotide--dimethylbenzimidazole phosphoribosyltransferase [Desulfovibrio sp.]|nr:nicotinate-nucleotide--dimethylbenzimidazole phosphoribosyltransferase [Desulfovibrio sp.]